MRSCRICIVLLTVVLTSMVSTSPARLQAEEAAVALVQAAGGTVYSLGPAVALPIQVANVQNLGAATVLVTYDPSLIKATGCQRNRQFDIGLCNYAYDRDEDGVPDSVLFNALSLEGVTADAVGMTMVNVSWQAVANVVDPATTVLGVQVFTFADDDGKALAVSSQNGVVTINPPRPLSRLFLPFVVRHELANEIHAP